MQAKTLSERHKLILKHRHLPLTCCVCAGLVKDLDPTIFSNLAQTLNYVTSTPVTSIALHALTRRRAQVVDLANQLRDSAQEMLAYANTLVPVGRLPEDLLVHVFTYLLPTAEVDIYRGVQLEVVIPKSWNSFASVCTRWRKMAFAHLSLWSTLILRRGTERLFQGMQERSGGSVLVRLAVEDRLKSSCKWRGDSEFTCWQRLNIKCVHPHKILYYIIFELPSVC
jgi:hypothetical protein